MDHYATVYINLAHDAILVRDPFSRVIHWNTGAEEPYGWTAQEALGRVTLALLKTRFPVDLAAIEAQLERDGHWEGEVAHTCRDGRLVTVGSRQVLVRDDEGQPRAVLEINRDITKRRESEQMVQTVYLETAERLSFMITMGVGIGEALVVGLSALDQNVANEPEAAGHIDVLCTPLQAQLFEEDTRLNRIIQTETLFYAGSRMSEWPRAIWLAGEGARVARLLRERHYEAVFPAMVAPGLYHAMHTRLMYPDLSHLGHDLLTRHAPSDLPVCVLPSYTDTGAADALKSALLPDFAGRVFTPPAEPRPTLLETAALIDQVDLFVTGDTGVMHLAAIAKRVRQAGDRPCCARNAVKIIALFGGSNPDVWGYS